MIGPGLPGATLEAFAEGFVTGLVGTLGITIDDGDGNNLVPRTTANIVEIETVDGNGVYRYLGVFPAENALITWDDAVSLTASEEITVSTEAPSDSSDIGFGPCSPWVTTDEVAACCSPIQDSSLDFVESAQAASELLFAFSGGQITGLCGPVTVRPCSSRCGCSPSGSWRWEGLGWACEGRPCGCSPLSRVRLANYPIREIAQVKIDGDVVAPSSYRLDENRYLTRKPDAATPTVAAVWPGCQRLDLDDDADGTFSVSYWYGRDPSQAAKNAAAELACQIFLSCAASADDADDCQIPAGVTRVTRLGITYDLEAFRAWGRDQTGAWRTGLAAVDAFLNAVNPAGIRRNPAIWSPDVEPFARPVG